MYASMQENPALEAARHLARQATIPAGNQLNVSLLEEQVCAEAGLWETAVARRALGQSRGDTAHAVSMLRVWAATQPHVPALPVDPQDVAILRRLTSAYPQIPGGQWLGLAPDLVPRQLNWNEDSIEEAPIRAEQPATSAPTQAGTPRVRDLIGNTRMSAEPADGDGDDPARTVLTPPYTRVNRLAMLARGETGALAALAALVLGRRQEAVMVELRVAVAGVRTPHPRSGVPCLIAEVPVTEVEVVVDADVDGRPGLAMGWGASLGTVERRAISLALLDAAMRADGELGEQLTLDEQTLVAASDGPATAGFVEHIRLPHYATFSAYVSGVTGTTP
ncbi:Alpha-D-ribose 1-methylphosphonate 5-triphosphate synthase subunit PhnI [Mycolicibacterium vanbaalenii]|uniref:Alpha-D-ribose 1-methylphosphonate 5-triphosphate synthase subunit PhnI n=1 Tax=Mycolicibacterium vanbaalenii TaxID=110539 RepID=A0A5S9QY08_MYCVN|nr:carbon-phosphorus lyase complex subunit PhnI [Mycolicibacterium vanbaalenii]CAA0123665.1 Alpha-D-ribose 1-methylphosphonate 5-triphosphate synthase subunit PhnI [Mycolicibacterium vanbaalenii]